MSDNTLILGAGGMLGSMLRCHLKVKCQDYLFFQSRFDSKDTSLVWCLGESEFYILERFILENNIKKIVMLYGGRAATEIDDSAELKLIEGCYEAFHKANVEKVLVASSSAIYANSDTEIYSESDEVSQCDPYQKQKVNLELLSKRFSNKFQDLSLMRLANVLGADSLTKLFVYSKNHDFILNKYTNGFLKRSYLSPSSLAHIIGELLYLDSSLPLTLNVSTYQGLYMDQILHGLGVSFRENKVEAEGRGVTLDTTLLRSLIAIPSKYNNVNFALKDLNDFKLWVGERINA
jgi:nucleoside-diphosphate-sugar epimerase